METVTPASYLTHPSLQHLTRLEPGCGPRSPKMCLICQDLVAHPMSTRRSVMGRVNPELDPDSNHCYWRRLCTDGESRYSVLINGLVQVVGRTPEGRLLYSLTEAGLRFALAG